MTRMPQTKPAPQHRPRLDETDAEQVILGVDSHQDTHVAAVITNLGAAVAHRAFPATAAGYRQLLAWARRFGRLRRAGVEGTGCYGVALARYLRTQAITVIEVNRPDRATRRRRGKTDAIDAQAAAYAVLSGRATTIAKTGDGPVEMTRMFKLAKASAVKSRTQAINQLKAVLVCADPPLRESLSGLGRMTLIRRCATLPAVEPVDAATAAVYTLRRLAQRILNLTDEIRDLQQRLTDVITAHAPQLLHPVGVGADSAAALLIAAGDNPDRLASEASFAALCGVSPIEMSSGKTERHRLNRGGNRHANAALYRIVLTRLRCDSRTQAYVDRRTAEGKTRRETFRCLKRYVAREIYNLLQPPSPSQTSPQT
jgi:transposase